MVLTGTDPERGRHGEDVHFKEDVAVFIYVCVQVKARRRGEQIWRFIIFVYFLSVYCMRGT